MSAPGPGGGQKILIIYPNPINNVQDRDAIGKSLDNCVKNFMGSHQAIPGGNQMVSWVYFQLKGNEFDSLKKFRMNVQNYISILTDMNRFQSFSGIAQNILNGCDGITLDLKNLKQKNLQSFFQPGVLDSLLLWINFLTSSSGGRFNIQTVDFTGNEVRNNNMFRNFDLFFPNIQNIVINGQSKPWSEIKSNAKSSTPNQYGAPGAQEGGSGIFQRNTGTFQQPQVESTLRIVKVKAVPPPRPLDVTTTTPVQHAADRLVLESFIPVSLDPDDFPTHQLILDFMDTAWSSLGSIGQFYSENATFSVSVADSPPGNPISEFEPVKINWLEPDTLDHRFIGPAQISLIQRKLFGTGFYAHPTTINASVLTEGIYSVVMHGAFANVNHQIFGFHRSFVIGDYGDELLIANDHIYITQPSHCKLSGYNGKEAEEIIKELEGVVVQ